jgi:predicted transposase YdaD
MHEYDIAFKLTLQQVDLAIRELTGTAIARWLNVELPEVRNTRVDLLGETESGELVHIELQSTNDAAMALRMAEYCLRVYRQFGRFPQQLVVYVGAVPARMSTELHGPSLDYSYRLVDIRELDGQRLLESPQVGDNIVAILTRLTDVRAAVGRILARIGVLEPAEREAALVRLLILSELRDLGEVVEEEARKMPILNDILDHKVLGREYKKGVEHGVQQGELLVLRRQIEKRFGPIPGWAEQRLIALSPAELGDLSVRVLDATSLAELLR